MSRKLKILNKRASKEKVLQIKKQIARRTKRVLFVVSTLLMAVCLFLFFKLGIAAWPVWTITHRTQIIGILLLAITGLVLLSPVIIEATSNSRALSGSDTSKVF
jgi:hypothetical protein